MRFALALVLGLAAACAIAEQYGGQTAADVLVEGKVDKVCEMKGCWLGLKGASGNAHVTFKDESFFVPQTLIGKTVRVLGKLTKVVTKAEVRYEMVASGLATAS